MTMIASPTTQVFATPALAARAVAAEVADLIRSRDAEGRTTVLGLATGGTPVPLYKELRRLHTAEHLSFRNVVTFNLDEYLGLGPNDAQSYRQFMQDQLFDHVDLPPAHTHIPDGLTTDIEAESRAYEQLIQDAGGIDLQILGIGTNGHIGFNEPGTPRHSRTRRVELTEKTRQDNARYFPSLEAVPTHALTMGCATILEAKRIALLAWGTSKAAIVRDSLHGPVTDQVPASFLQEHPDTTFFLDEDAASALS